MNALWSFWTKPYFAERRSSWYSEWHHWLAWGLSVYAARQHYPETYLVTDDAGARILIDALRLPFEHVSTTLNAIADEDPGWWALGKIVSYRRQRAAFVHVDTDVFLWKPLKPGLEQADVFAQNPEPIVRNATCYYPEELERAVRGDARGWLPPEWTWYGGAKSPRAECCGIFGGRHLEFIQHYADTAFKLVTNPRNRAALRLLSGKIGHTILIEQYLLSACLEYHRQRSRSPYRGIQIRYVFDRIEDAYHPENAATVGFTHLAAGAKRNARVCRDLEQRVRQDLPEYYDRCLRFF